MLEEANEVHADQKHLTTELDTLQERVDRASNAEERNALTQQMERDKSNLAELKIVERDRSASLVQMEQRLQIAQDKLAAIEDELGAVIAQLRPISKGEGK